MTKFFTLAFALFLGAQQMAAQCKPELLNCNPDFPLTFCDFSPNNEQYWSDILWWDNANQSHDLAEVGTTLNVSYRDTCPLSDISVRCLLFLDLDGNGVRETRIDSDNLPAAGEVNYGNEISAGSPRQFDQRPVPAGQKWRFALETSQSGDTSVTYLRWNSADAPNVFAHPELPPGYHRVRWEIRDASGVLSTCEYNFTVKDCQAPVVTCLNGLSVNLMPTRQIQLWASDFLVFTTDNVTPSSLIKIGVRKAGTGTGFPVNNLGEAITSLLFDCTELDTQRVELWAIDVQGNAGYCETNVVVGDNNHHCDGFVNSLVLCTTPICSSDGIGMPASFKLEYDLNGQPASFYDAIEEGCGPTSLTLPTDTEVTITPESFDVAGGISTFDMVIISRHIDGTDSLDQPYQFIAADANRDHVIDNNDVLVCRDHILGIQPLTNPWRFFPKSAVTPWPDDPLNTTLPSSITINTNNPPSNGVEFVAVLLCNVSCGNLVGFFELSPEEQHLIGTPQPNPTSGGAMLPLQLLENETVVFELVDAAGRLVYQQSVALPPGDAMFEIPADAMPASGLYFWRLQAGAVLKSGKIIRQ